jgi:hypothetical protein
MEQLISFQKDFRAESPLRNALLAHHEKSPKEGKKSEGGKGDTVSLIEHPTTFEISVLFPNSETDTSTTNRFVNALKSAVQAEHKRYVLNPYRHGRSK